MADEKKGLRRRTAKARSKRAGGGVALGAAGRELLTRLVERTGLSPQQIVERALTAYAAAVAPGLAEQAAVAGKTIGRAPAARAPKAPRLFVSLDNGPEREVRPPEAVIGRDPACELRADVSLISPRHARLALREGRWLFEDLRSERGSYKGGQRIEVAFLTDGDEIDLAGFLPARFRLG